MHIFLNCNGVRWDRLKHWHSDSLPFLFPLFRCFVHTVCFMILVCYTSKVTKGSVFSKFLWNCNKNDKHAKSDTSDVWVLVTCSLLFFGKAVGFFVFFSLLPRVFSTYESGIGSETEACWIFQAAAGCQMRRLAVIEEISQSGPGNNTNNKSISTLKAGKTNLHNTFLCIINLAQKIRKFVFGWLFLCCSNAS